MCFHNKKKGNRNIKNTHKSQKKYFQNTGPQGKESTAYRTEGEGRRGAGVKIPEASPYRPAASRPPRTPRAVGGMGIYGVPADLHDKQSLCSTSVKRITLST